MFDVVELFKTMAENSNLKTVSERNDGDYIGKDGLIYCGKCHSPRQCKTELLGKIYVCGCVCKCQSAKENYKSAQKKLQDRIIENKKKSDIPAIFSNSDYRMIENPEYRKFAYNYGNKVIHSHISEGKDFYSYEPIEKWDCIISNPPFTNKRKIFERALSFNKPFALIMSNTWLNDSAPKQLFMDKDLQLLMFDKRMKFENNGEVNNKITFSSSYFCFNILPKQIIMEKLTEYKDGDYNG